MAYGRAGGVHSTVQLTRASGSAARCLIDLHIPYTLRIRDQHVISQCKARNNAIDYLSILRGYFDAIFYVVRGDRSDEHGITSIRLDTEMLRFQTERVHTCPIAACCMSRPMCRAVFSWPPHGSFVSSRFDESLRERRGPSSPPVAEGRGINRIINMYSRTGDLASIASSERRISELGPGDVGAVSPSVLISSAA